jgi:hypothetical protein
VCASPFDSPILFLIIIKLCATQAPFFIHGWENPEAPFRINGFSSGQGTYRLRLYVARSHGEKSRFRPSAGDDYEALAGTCCGRPGCRAHHPGHEVVLLLDCRIGYFAKTSVPFRANRFRAFMVPKQLSIRYLYRLFHGAVA